MFTAWVLCLLLEKCQLICGYGHGESEKLGEREGGRLNWREREMLSMREIKKNAINEIRCMEIIK
jgi:hypothetical protein